MTRTEQIKQEIEYGFSKMQDLGRCVAILGSARIRPEHKYYKLTIEIAQKLSKLGYGIITGGGPGIMEAGNKGTMQHGGKSIGLNIELPFEQAHNEYISPEYQLNFQHFFTRKLIIVEYSSAYIVMPGGFGTLDELFDIITLMQTEKIAKAPIVLVGREFWSGLLEWLKNKLLPERLISQQNLDFLLLSDDAEETVKHIESFER